MYRYHFLNPEGMWGVFCNGSFVAMFNTAAEAADYCARHNARNGG